MQEGKRQKQIAGLLNEELNDIFQRLSLSMIDGGMVSISGVKITPDLLEARIYLSFFQVKDAKATLKKIEDRAWEIKKELTARVAKQLRRMPELTVLPRTIPWIRCSKWRNCSARSKKMKKEKRKNKTDRP